MNFNEYYKHYLSLHQNLWCRRLHVVGQLTTIFFIVSCIFGGIFWFLLLSPFIIYPFAWSGHYFFEKNKPAAFTDPLRAKAADWFMLKDWLLGRIER
tara:strand:- start:93 stop:383 length:291 start_codon:yes stop_codon:yes gene_type:complete